MTLIVWPLLALVIVAVGWVEDVAARRGPRLWPDGGSGHRISPGRERPGESKVAHRSPRGTTPKRGLPSVGNNTPTPCGGA